MNSLEDRIRDAFRADANTVRPGTIPPAPPHPARRAPSLRTSRRARVLIPLAAAAAVLALVTGLSLAKPQLLPGVHPASPAAGGPQPTPLLTVPPVRDTPPPPYPGPVPRPVLAPEASRQAATSASSVNAPPPFYVTFGGGPLTIRSTATGQVVAHVSPPPHTDGFSAIAATGDHTFVAAVFSSQQQTCLSQLYQFRLDNQGQPGPLTPLNITVPGNFAEFGTLAVTPDGRTIAYDSLLCGYSEAEIGVISLATGKVRIWTVNSRDFTWALSLSADGRRLAYGAESGGAWVLNTSAPEGPADKSARAVSKTAGWAALAKDGDSLVYCAVSPASVPGPRHGTVTYETTNLASGSRQVLATWTGLPDPQCWAGLDPSGRYLLVQYPTTPPPSDSGYVRPVIFDIRSGRTTDVAAPAFYGPLDVAW